MKNGQLGAFELSAWAIMSYLGLNMYMYIFNRFLWNWKTELLSCWNGTPGVLLSLYHQISFTCTSDPSPEIIPLLWCSPHWSLLEDVVFASELYACSTKPSAPFNVHLCYLEKPMMSFRLWPIPGVILISILRSCFLWWWILMREELRLSNKWVVKLY